MKRRIGCCEWQQRSGNSGSAVANVNTMVGEASLLLAFAPVKRRCSTYIQGLKWYVAEMIHPNQKMSEHGCSVENKMWNAFSTCSELSPGLAGTGLMRSDGTYSNGAGCSSVSKCGVNAAAAKSTTKHLVSTNIATMELLISHHHKNDVSSPRAQQRPIYRRSANCQNPSTRVYRL